MSNKFISIKPQNWEEIIDICKRLDSWVFRGQSNAEWSLETTIERGMKSYPQEYFDNRRQELIIYMEFRRRAKQYLMQLPEDKSYVEWMSLIQHYGGPTRFLDFTYSFYIGTFFAVENTAKDSALWAINNSVINKKTEIYITNKNPNVTPLDRGQPNREVAEDFFSGRE